MGKSKKLDPIPKADAANPSPGDDLADLFENETATVTIYDPRDKYVVEKRDTGFRVEIGALWSPEAQEIARENRGRLKLVDGNPDPEDPALNDTIFEQVIAVTKRWWKVGKTEEGIIVDGELLACTPENVRKVYTHPRLGWLYDDVRAAYLDRSRFFGQRSKTA